jgi:hypothetical protein
MLALMENNKWLADYVTAFGYGNYNIPSGSELKPIKWFADHVESSLFDPMTFEDPGFDDSDYDEGMKQLIAIIDGINANEALKVIFNTDGGEEFTTLWADRFVQSLQDY